MTPASRGVRTPLRSTVSSGPGEPDRGIAIVTGIAVVLVLAAPMLRAPSVYDEGFALVNAVRIGGGQAPYLDFWTVYTPGEYYLLAGVFRVFGEQVLLARSADVPFKPSSAGRFMPSCVRAPRAARASGVTILISVMIAVFAQPLYPVLTALLLSLAALRLLIPALGPGGRRLSLVAVGALAGTSGWFRQDDGVYALLMVFVVTLVARSTDPDSPGLRAGLARLARDGGAVAAGLAAAFAVLFLPWALVVPQHVLVDQLVVHPTTVSRGPPHPLPLPGSTTGLGPLVAVLLRVLAVPDHRISWAPSATGHGEGAIEPSGWSAWGPGLCSPTSLDDRPVRHAPRSPQLTWPGPGGALSCGVETQAGVPTLRRQASSRTWCCARRDSRMDPTTPPWPSPTPAEPCADGSRRGEHGAAAPGTASTSDQEFVGSARHTSLVQRRALLLRGAAAGGHALPREQPAGDRHRASRSARWSASSERAQPP